MARDRPEPLKGAINQTPEQVRGNRSAQLPETGLSLFRRFDQLIHQARHPAFPGRAQAVEVGRFVPSTVIALKIARFFGVPVEDVFALTVSA